MQNENGNYVELYMPRRCDWTHRVIDSRDHASVMINVARLDPKTGVATGEVDTVSISGYVRSKGESDAAMCELCKDM